MVKDSSAQASFLWCGKESSGGDMDLRALVETVKNKGVTFKIEGERIKVESQTEPDHETKSILDTLRDRKEELLRVLTSPACAVCGGTMTRTKDIYGKNCGPVGSAPSQYDDLRTS
jgi:hypothetical protein